MLPRTSGNRPSSGSVSASHTRNPTRSHAHSLSVGSLNSQHRVDRRRKSTSSHNSAVNVVALGSVAEGIDTLKSMRRISGKPAMPANSPFASSLPAGNGFGQSSFDSKPSGSAVMDGPALASLPEAHKASKARSRRASDGSRLSRGEGRQIIVCDTCGKAYKHSSCLAKHRWEHTPEWSITSKLLISKHQQVQLLEAAHVLVQMNKQSGTTDSDVSSDAPSDGVSSTGSPPPPSEIGVDSGRLESKRFSSNSSLYSQSYQSSLSENFGRPYIVHARQMSSDNRPTTAGTSYTEDDRESSMSAAFGLLSCRSGTPRTGPVVITEDAPPVPPLPAKYLGQSVDQLSGSTITGIPSAARRSSIRDPLPDDVDMLSERAPMYAGGRSDDEDEGMFGRMEE